MNTEKRIEEIYEKIREMQKIDVYQGMAIFNLGYQHIERYFKAVASKFSNEVYYDSITKTLYIKK